MGFKFVNDVDWRSARDEGGGGSIVLQKVVEVTRHGHSTRSTSRKKASPIRITKLGGRELSAAAGAELRKVEAGVLYRSRCASKYMVASRNQVEGHSVECLLRRHPTLS